MILLVGIVVFIAWVVYLRSKFSDKNDTLIASVSVVCSLLSLVLLYYLKIIVLFAYNIFMVFNY